MSTFSELLAAAIFREASDAIYIAPRPAPDVQKAAIYSLTHPWSAFEVGAWEVVLDECAELSKLES